MATITRSASLTEQTAECFHCGQSLTGAGDPRVLEDRSFCSQNCLTAFQSIRSNGLGDYYKWRDSYGHTPVAESHLPVAPEPDHRGNYCLYLHNMSCVTCAWLAEKMLDRLPQVAAADVDYTSSRLEIQPATEYNADDWRTINKTLNSVGYELSEAEQSEADSLAGIAKKKLIDLGTAFFTAGNNMLISIALYSGYFGTIDHASKYILELGALVLATVTLLVPARSILIRAAHSIRLGTVGSDLLLSVSFVLAYIYSSYLFWTKSAQPTFFDTITAVTFIVLLARYVEFQIERRAGRDLLPFLHKLPARVTRILPGGGTEAVQPEKLPAGSVIELAPGDIVPVTGTLVYSNAEVDEQVLTGEFEVKKKEIGAQITAGCRVIRQPIRIKIETTGGESSLKKLKTKVAELTSRRSREVELSIKAGRIFSSVVLVLGAGVFGYYWASGSNLSESVLLALPVFIVACPCALAVAIPIVHTLANRLAVSRGIVVGDAATYSRLLKTKHILFDKTGTLTNGKFDVRKVETEAGISETELLRIAGTLEAPLNSSHPIAASLAPFAGDTAVSVRYLPGKGLIGSYRAGVYYVGRRLSGAERTYEAGESEVVVVEYFPKRRELGRIILADEIKNDAQAATRELNRTHSLAILSGDENRRVASVAVKLGIKDYQGAMSATGKTEFIKGLGRSAVMVGDGFNDAKAMASSNVGITFLDTNQISLTAANVVLLYPKLTSIPFLLHLAKRTRRTIKQNLTFAILYNVIFLPLAMAGMISPAVGALCMVASSLVVLINSYRLVSIRNWGMSQ